MQTVEEIIKYSNDSRELKRALAVKMSLTRIKHQDIANFLQVSPSFISKWCLIYEQQGALALLLNYQGKVGYLSEDEKQEVILFLRQHSHFSLEQLRDHLEEKYQVVYKSKQSYYDLLNEGGLSWKKTKKKIRTPTRFWWRKLKNQLEIKLKEELHRFNLVKSWL